MTEENLIEVKSNEPAQKEDNSEKQEVKCDNAEPNSSSANIRNKSSLSIASLESSGCSETSVGEVLESNRRIITKLKKQLNNQKMQLSFFLQQGLRRNEKVISSATKPNMDMIEENDGVCMAMCRFNNINGRKSRILKMHERLSSLEDQACALLRHQEVVLCKIVNKLFGCKAAATIATPNGNLLGQSMTSIRQPTLNPLLSVHLNCDLTAHASVTSEFRQIVSAMMNPADNNVNLFNQLLNSTVSTQKALSQINSCAKKIIAIEEDRNSLVDQIYRLPPEQRVVDCNSIPVKSMKSQLIEEALILEEALNLEKAAKEMYKPIELLQCNKSNFNNSSSMEIVTSHEAVNIQEILPVTGQSSLAALKEDAVFNSDLLISKSAVEQQITFSNDFTENETDPDDMRQSVSDSYVELQANISNSDFADNVQEPIIVQREFTNYNEFKNSQSEDEYGESDADDSAGHLKETEKVESYTCNVVDSEIEAVQRFTSEVIDSEMQRIEIFTSSTVVDGKEQSEMNRGDAEGSQTECGNLVSLTEPPADDAFAISNELDESFGHHLAYMLNILESEAGSLVECTNDKRDRYVAELEKIRKENGELYARLRNIQTAARQRDELAARVARFERDLAGLHEIHYRNVTKMDRMYELDSECETLRREVVKLKEHAEQIPKLETQIQNLQIQLNSSEIVKQERNQLRKDLDDLRAVQTAYHALVTGYERREQDIKKLTKQVENLRNVERERDEMRSELGVLCHSVTEQMEQIRHLFSIIEELGRWQQQQQQHRATTSQRLSAGMDRAGGMFDIPPQYQQATSSAASPMFADACSTETVAVETSGGEQDVFKNEKHLSPPLFKRENYSTKKVKQQKSENTNSTPDSSAKNDKGDTVIDFLTGNGHSNSPKSYHYYNQQIGVVDSTQCFYENKDLSNKFFDTMFGTHKMSEIAKIIENKRCSGDSLQTSSDMDTYAKYNSTNVDNNTEKKCTPIENKCDDPFHAGNSSSFCKAKNKFTSKLPVRNVKSITTRKDIGQEKPVVFSCLSTDIVQGMPQQNITDEISKLHQMLKESEARNENDGIIVSWAYSGEQQQTQQEARDVQRDVKTHSALATIKLQSIRNELEQGSDKNNEVISKLKTIFQSEFAENKRLLKKCMGDKRD